MAGGLLAAYYRPAEKYRQQASVARPDAGVSDGAAGACRRRWRDNLKAFAACARSQRRAWPL